MAPLGRLRDIGVKVYQQVNEVPYVRDDSWGTFKGSYGTVYRATSRMVAPLVGQGNVYAIKEIHAVSPQDQQNVAQEIQFLRQLRHDNILELEEAFTIDTEGHRLHHTIYLVTKPWAPVSFHHFIQDLVSNAGNSTCCPWFKPQKLEPWPSIVQQCLSGLEYLHSQEPNPIRHKDIKPHNILLYYDAQGSETPEVRPIIIDFGISKEHIDGATTANTGTYEYKAPEQIEKQGPTLASDIFSLGCCFALIEGVLTPWPGLSTVYSAAMGTDTCQFANNADLVDSTLLDLHSGQNYSESYALWYFHPRFRGLVRQMLKKEPPDRPSAKSALRTVSILTGRLSAKIDTFSWIELDPILDTTLESQFLRLIESYKVFEQKLPILRDLVNCRIPKSPNDNQLSAIDETLPQRLDKYPFGKGCQHATEEDCKALAELLAQLEGWLQGIRDMVLEGDEQSEKLLKSRGYNLQTLLPIELCLPKQKEVLSSHITNISSSLETRKTVKRATRASDRIAAVATKKRKLG